MAVLKNCRVKYVNLNEEESKQLANVNTRDEYEKLGKISVMHVPNMGIISLLYIFSKNVKQSILKLWRERDGQKSY